jgi:hypothetical protein
MLIPKVEAKEFEKFGFKVAERTPNMQIRAEQTGQLRFA